jgi:twin arginine-targeting protein translocase tatC
MGKDNVSQTFWDHLDALRVVIAKIAVITVATRIIAFLFKEEMFSVILAPKRPGFVTYDLIGAIRGLMGDSIPPDFEIQLINTGLAEQFIIHMKMAVCVGILVASPYIIYQLFRFVSPALYIAVKTVAGGYLMFILGILTSYFLIFPLTFRFLGTYQVDTEVVNMISLQSYISTLMVMSHALGIVFEMPVIAWLFGKLGFISPAFMRTYRKHAIVIILIIAAIITPTSDIFTSLLVSLPMCILYEISIYLVRKTQIAKHTTVIVKS